MPREQVPREQVSREHLSEMQKSWSFKKPLVVLCCLVKCFEISSARAKIYRMFRFFAVSQRFVKSPNSHFHSQYQVPSNSKRYQS
jgi:hypothetical protein